MLERQMSHRSIYIGNRNGRTLLTAFGFTSLHDINTFQCQETEKKQEQSRTCKLLTKLQVDHTWLGYDESIIY